MQKEQKLLNWILVFLCDTITLPGKTRLEIYGSGNRKESQRISVVSYSLDSRAVLPVERSRFHFRV